MIFTSSAVFVVRYYPRKRNGERAQQIRQSSNALPESLFRPISRKYCKHADRLLRCILALRQKKASRESAGGASFYYFQAAATLYSGGKSVKRRIELEERKEFLLFTFSWAKTLQEDT